MWNHGDNGVSAWLGNAPYGYEDAIRLALAEDLFAGDPSADSLGDLKCDWYIEAQQTGILCGAAIAAEVLHVSPPAGVRDGMAVQPGTVICEGKGLASFILTRERTALNFLMHLSGIASLTQKYVDAVAGTSAKIADTRKTIPGLRMLQKYAVKCGGGSNHRMNLGGGVMIKDNHILAAGSIAEAVRRVRESMPHTVRIEVECEARDQVAEAVAAGAEVVMLDNMAPDKMAEIVAEFHGRTIFEASGGINLTTVRAVAESGVDFISVGALTHSAPALSLHLELRHL